MIPGAAPIIGGIVLPDIVWEQHASSTGDSNSYSFSSAIGDGTANFIIVGVYLFSKFPAHSPPGSVKVGGNSATLLGNVAGSLLNNLSLWIAPAPSGTTASVVITDSDGGTGVQIEVWAAYRLKSATPIDTIIASGSLNTSPGGIVAAAVSGTTSQTYSFSGVNTDDPGFTSSGVAMGAGSIAKTSSGSRSVSVSTSSGSAFLIAASFR